MGYFSQLAQHTGLSFERGDATAARSSDTAHAVIAPHVDTTPVAPLHVEEVTFSDPVTPNVFAESDEGLAGRTVDASGPVGTPDDRHGGQTETRDAASARSEPATQTASEASAGSSFAESSLRFTDFAASTRASPAHDTEVQTLAGARRIAQISDERAQAGVRLEPPESFAEIKTVADRSALTDDLLARNQSAARRAATAQALRASEPSDAASDERTERAALVRNYLNEVRAWVSAPPEFAEREQPVDARQESRALFALEQEVYAPSSAHDGRPEGLAEQNLNLSIGSISIVIEEPQQSTPAPLAAPPRVEHAPAQTTSEATRLSRYYLRSW